MDMHEDAIRLWDDMMVKVIAFNDALNIKRGKGPKPAPEPEPETLKPYQIANRAMMPVAKAG
jgi:uroporphyrinogen-III decarboxylase